MTRWERSVQTAKTFASRERVSAQSLAWWKRKLGRDAKPQKLGFVKLDAVAPSVAGSMQRARGASLSGTRFVTARAT